LKAIYSLNTNISWIDPDVPNSSIFALNPKLIVTVYGSIAPEAGYAGIPVLLAGDHPAINFKIGHVAKTKNEYFNLLLSSTWSSNSVKDEFISFVSQNNYNLYMMKDCSLIVFIGIDFSELYKNPDILDSDAVAQFLEAECKNLAKTIYNQSISPELNLH
jgi:hypothetical protein